ncbi:MAG: hypothetical protein ACK4GB_00555 [Tepidimonas sp.]
MLIQRLEHGPHHGRVALLGRQQRPFGGAVTVQAQHASQFALRLLL